MACARWTLLWVALVSGRRFLAYGGVVYSLSYMLCFFLCMVKGGCPYAKGATGNVATEDVVYFLNDFGIEHGIDLIELVKVGNSISKELGRSNQSKVGRALSAKYDL